jgi:hypothetical protein
MFHWMGVKFVAVGNFDQSFSLLLSPSPWLLTEGL